MPSESLHAPWRMDYIRGLTQESRADQPPKKDECFFCQAIAATEREDRKRRGVLWVGDLSIVMINLFPYTNGHLLIAGEKQIGVNHNVDVLRYSGQVDPRAIQPGNSVQSAQIANVRIEHRGRGAQAEAQGIGWLGRFFLNVLPI